MGKRRVMFASAAVVVGAIGAGGVATARSSHEHFLVTLRGSQEVPPADPDGRATARLDIDTESGMICWDLHFSRIATPTMAHIHNEVRGKNGPIVVFFFGDAAHPMPDPDVLERGRASGCNDEDPALATAIAEHPDQYYVNIHNTRFGAGAVRGQIK
jgi:hypothetical protein